MIGSVISVVAIIVTRFANFINSSYPEPLFVTIENVKSSSFSEMQY
jgi:hypothetical protein